MDNTLVRQSHAALDVESRQAKAEKIERLLELDRVSAPLRILEVGCGSGGISHYLGTRAIGHMVVAVDVVDIRRVHEGYDFILVSGVDLPFEDGSFDIVLSNHVIEHVGSPGDQLRHLREIHRVMGKFGSGYVAVPNRWRLIEPHYRLPLLSAWPRQWRSPYLRMMRKGTFYDCEPLAAARAESLFRSADLQYRRLGVDALRVTLEIEHPGRRLTRLAQRTPSALLRALEPWMPTLTYEVRRR